MKNLEFAKKCLDLTRPQVMGILNLSPGSFSEIGRCTSLDTALRHAEGMVKAGAGLIDIGAEPTNPANHPVADVQQELDRLIPVLEALQNVVDIPISIDTSKPEVMRAAIAAGGDMINDVRALRLEGALETVADLGVPVCLMHMAYPLGMPEHPQADLYDGDVVDSVKRFLQTRIQACMNAGIPAEQILIDPGIGHGNFGKNLQQNLRVLHDLKIFLSLEKPLLIGVSRKTFIGEMLEQSIEERLSGSLAAAAWAVAEGAHIIRAHDVAETVSAVRMAYALRECDTC